jgi:hypothetical protein
LSPAPFLRAGPGGVELAVKVTPRARRARLGGTVIDAAGAAWLAVSVTEPAEAGRATRAAQRLVAARCHLPAGAVTLLSGAASRWKRLRVAGDAAMIAARLAEPGSS